MLKKKGQEKKETELTEKLVTQSRAGRGVTKDVNRDQQNSNKGGDQLIGQQLN